MRQLTAPTCYKNETNEVVRDKIITVIRTVKAPDGTVTRDRTTTTDRVETVNVVASTPVVPKDWIVGIGYSVQRNYSAYVQRRILGPVFLGAQVNSKGELLGTIAVEF